VKKKLFATGMGGCVGHYLFDELAKRDDLDMTFLLRSPQKVRYNLNGIDVIQDDFKNIEKYAAKLKEADLVVHLLADWGTELGNYDQTKALLGCLDPSKVKKIIYFSTASILGRDNNPDPEALLCGTPYIRGKYKMHEELSISPLREKIITLYPTWVLGGDSLHPYSHAYLALKNTGTWLRLLSFFDLDLRFHFIHAKDIARVAQHLLFNEAGENEFVLGTKEITVGKLIEGLASASGFRPPFRIKLGAGFAKAIDRVFGGRFAPWDRHCLKTYHQNYRTVEPSSFGLETSFPSIESIAKDLLKN